MLRIVQQSKEMNSKNNINLEGICELNFEASKGMTCNTSHYLSTDETLNKCYNKKECELHRIYELTRNDKTIINDMKSFYKK